MPKPLARRPARRGGLPTLLALAACTALAAPQALAQTSPSSAPQRVEITGSSIKRVASETALPVQVVTREDMVKAGITTAAELVASLSATAGNLTDGVSIANGGYRDQMGLNAANLRGMGTSSTLVLLNGRRMANFAAPGDDVAVDLNTIPAAAIHKVEILLDGASAIYGSDAIGGVINFITRKDYQGLQLDAHLGGTQEGGAGKRTASLSAGTGDLDRDGFNLFGVVDLQKTGALRTSQRKFINDLQVPARLPHLLSSATFPGNIRLTGDQRDAAQAAGFSLNGSVIENRTVNLAIPGCQPPHTLYLPAGIGGVDGCTYDYMRDLELYPKSEKQSFLGRGVLRLTPDHQLFAEATYARAKTWYVSTSNRVDGDIDLDAFSDDALRAMNPLLVTLRDALPAGDRLITVRTRLLDGGNRSSELVSTGRRLVLGATGQLGGWDYDAGLSQAVSTVSERDGHGYLLYDQVLEGFADGRINPFGPSSAAGLALLDSAQVNQEVRRARGTMTTLDAKASRSLSKLAGGDLTLALGAELRRETTRSSASDLLMSDNILGDSTPGGEQFTDYSRRMWAFFGELSAPLTRSLELQLALRHDHYEQVGGSTTPKLALSWTADPALKLRGSFGTGFRAPSMNDLYRATKVSATSTLADPVCMAENDNDLAFCADNWETRVYSNDKLKPERSRQFSLGLVAAPHPQWTLSVDYWNVAKRDLISTLGDDVILANLAKYEPLVHRYNEDEGLAGCDYDASDSAICYIELRKENRGRLKAAGLDLGLEHRSGATAWGQFVIRLVGTLTLQSKQQTGYGDPYVSNLGRFVTDRVVQRWRHRLSVDWDRGPWGLSLANTFSSGYTDQNSAIDTDSGTVVAANKVKAYSLWDLSGRWSPMKALSLRAGVKNLFNTAPPFSNQAYHFISGYDPSYTDPRGRSFYLSASYSFR